MKVMLVGCLGRGIVRLSTTAALYTEGTTDELGQRGARGTWVRDGIRDRQDGGQVRTGWYGNAVP